MVPILVLTITGVLMAFAIGLVVKYFGVTPDPRAEKIGELMTGANCGGCGFAGCGAYVNAMLEGKAKPGLCPSMSEENVAKVSKILGTAAEKREPKMAVVLCRGGDDVAKYNSHYNGVNDCRNATFVAGGCKSCTYGCLGMGTCARACPFGAIEITQHNLAKVHPEYCVGCGKCVEICPRGIIKLVPREAKVHVFCSSPLAGKLKMQMCKGACIGCHKCEKAAETGQVTFEGMLARISTENMPGTDLIEKAGCPTHCLGQVEKTDK